ncbi:hypothetical protein PWY87_10195 [Kribbella solani]|uniref:hypothetical protein n=1 Tax=Kribbella solani TaxID=236067 RepID=UPI0029AEB782|nr:hypothetical protein [Kribbella solani]MDX3002040.1 hypothetical protein [Kribbella solani]
MSTASPSQQPTAAELILVTPQPDDAGASTADRFEWQAAMGAADGLAHYLKFLDSHEPHARILCEVHEDWVLIHGADAELVSAKHHEPAFGAYTTLNQLITHGGLGHLLKRWQALQEQPSCRLVTTPGLAAGDPQNLEKAIAWLKEQPVEERNGGPFEAVVDAFANALVANEALTASDTPEVRRATVIRFLSVLTIDHGRPLRTYLPYAAPSMYAQAVVEVLGASVPPDAVWEAVLGLFRTRMRAAGPTRTRGLPTVLPQVPTAAPSGPLDAAELAHEPRFVTMADIHLAVDLAISNPQGFQPLPKLVRLTTVAIKMSAGKCTDTSIERAEELRRAYDAYWRDREGTDATARAERARVGRALLAMADEATSLVVDDDGPWGRALWTELQSTIRAVPSAPDLDSDLLLGGICSLSNQCKVWFSDGFDIDAERRRLKHLRDMGT